MPSAVTTTCSGICESAADYWKNNELITEADVQNKCKAQGHTNLDKCMICHDKCRTGVAGTTDAEIAKDMEGWRRVRGVPVNSNDYMGPQWYDGYEFNKECVTPCTIFGETSQDDTMAQDPIAPFTKASVDKPCQPYQGDWPASLGPRPCLGGSKQHAPINPDFRPPWCYTDKDHICTNDPRWGYCDWRWFPKDCLGSVTGKEIPTHKCTIPVSGPGPASGSSDPFTSTNSAPSPYCDVKDYILPDIGSDFNLNVNDPAFDWGGYGSYKSPWLKNDKKIQHTILDPQPQAQSTAKSEIENTLDKIYKQMVDGAHIDTINGTVKQHPLPVWEKKDLLYLNGYNLDAAIAMDTEVASNYLPGLYNNQNQAQRINLNGVSTPLGGTISKIGEGYTGFNYYNTGWPNTYVPGYGPSPASAWEFSESNSGSNPNASDARLDMCGYFLASRPMTAENVTNPPMFANLKIEHAENPLYYPGWWYTTDWECYYTKCIAGASQTGQDQDVSCYVDISLPCAATGVPHWAWEANHDNPTSAYDLQNCYVQNNLWNTGYNQYLSQKAYLNIAGIEYDNQLFRLPKATTDKILTSTWQHTFDQAYANPQLNKDPVKVANELTDQVLKYQLKEDMIRSSRGPGSVPIWDYTDDAKKYMAPAASQSDCFKFIQQLNNPASGPASPYTPVIAWQHYGSECRGIPLENQGEHTNKMVTNSAGKDPIPLRVQSGGVVISGKGKQYYDELKEHTKNPATFGQSVKNDFGVDVRWDVDPNLQYCNADTGLSNNFMDALTGNNVMCHMEKDGQPTKSPNYLWLPDHMVVIGNKKITIENVPDQSKCYSELAKIRDNGIFQSYISSVNKYSDPITPDIKSVIRKVDNPPIWANYNEALKTCDILNPLTVEGYDVAHDKANSGSPMYVFGQYVQGAYDRIYNTEDAQYPANVALWPRYRGMHGDDSIYLTDEHNMPITKNLVPIAPSPLASTVNMGAKPQYRVRDCLDWSMENGYPWVVFDDGKCKAMNTKYWTTNSAGTDSQDAWRYGDYDRPFGNDPFKVDGNNWAHNPEPWAKDDNHTTRKNMKIGMILDTSVMNDTLKKCCTREMSYKNKGSDALIPCPEGIMTLNSDLLERHMNVDPRSSQQMCTWEELHCPTSLQEGNDCDVIMENWCKDANRKLGQGKWPTECQCMSQRLQMVDKDGHQIDPNVTGGVKTLGTYSIEQLPDSIATAIKSNIYCTADACHTIGDEVYKPLIMRVNDGAKHIKDTERVRVLCEPWEKQKEDCIRNYAATVCAMCHKQSPLERTFNCDLETCHNIAKEKCENPDVAYASPGHCSISNSTMHTTTYDPEACPSELCFTVSNIIGENNQLQTEQDCGGQANFINGYKETNVSLRNLDEHVLPTDLQKISLLRVILLLIIFLCAYCISKYFIATRPKVNKTNKGTK